MPGPFLFKTIVFSKLISSTFATKMLKHPNCECKSYEIVIYQAIEIFNVTLDLS